MFHFSGFRVSFPILFRKEQYHIIDIRLPHSEITGSKPVCGSPMLIAAYHVLHRLLAPRHPLCALKSLISFSKFSFVTRQDLSQLRNEIYCHKFIGSSVLIINFSIISSIVSFVFYNFSFYTKAIPNLVGFEYFQELFYKTKLILEQIVFC